MNSGDLVGGVLILDVVGLFGLWRWLAARRRARAELVDLAKAEADILAWRSA